MSAGEYPGSPQVAVGAIVKRENEVLLVKRNQPPSVGLWAIPGGRVELGETLQQAAEREILEETGLTVRAGNPVYTFDVIERDDDGRVRFHYIIVDVVADYVGGEIRAGGDVSEARWVTLEEVRGFPVSQTTRSVLEDMIGTGS